MTKISPRRHRGLRSATAQALAAEGAEVTVNGLTGIGVTVNSVLPGPTASEGVGEFIRQLAQTQGVDVPTVERRFFETARPSSILQRFASLNKVASMIVYVCSERASATIGAALRVDGGVIRSVV